MSTPAIGVFLPTMTGPGEQLTDVVAAARRAEELGFESIWAVDQLVGGTGVPLLDSTVALAAAAGATTRIGLGFGVMILPLRPVVWAAKQVASLQQVSGGRVLLGVGVGGDRHDLSWAAAGVSRRERGRRTDDALAVLADLVAGEAVELDGGTVQLAPGAAVPPIVVGGAADAALDRVIRFGDSWFSFPFPPEQLAPVLARLAARSEAAGRPVPGFTGSMSVAIDGDPALPGPDELVRRLTDPDGMFGIPEEAVADMVLTGPPPAVADRIRALGELGAERVVVTLAAGDWTAQAALLAEAAEIARRDDGQTGR